MQQVGRWLCVILCMVAGNVTRLHGQETADGVTVYHRLSELDMRDHGKGPTATIALHIQGSSGLKLAFLARATGGIDTVPLNMFDRVSQDNTTPKAYAHVDATWRPILYSCDRFRYNSSQDTVRPDAQYVNLRFHGRPTAGNKGSLWLRNLVIYRGEDTIPPREPSAVSAVPRRDGVQLSWQEASDHVGVAFYVISRAHQSGPFIKIAQSASLDYLDRPPTIGTYQYRVLAVDFQENLSPWSTPTSVTVTQAFPIPQSTAYERDRLGYAEHIRHIHASGQGKVRKGQVLLFGDSLTGALLYQLQTEAALGRYQVEARGRAGWRTNQGRQVIADDLKDTNPEYCLILYGTNNLKGPEAIKTAMQDVLAMARACEANGTVPVLGTIPPRGFTDPTSAPEARYNAALIQMAQANQLPIAYLFQDFQALPDRRQLLANDGVHWDKAGFFAASRVWKKVMDQVTFALLDRPD